MRVTTYSCHRAAKTVRQDHYEVGPFGPTWTEFDVSVDAQADSLAGLFDSLTGQFGVNVKGVSPAPLEEGRGYVEVVRHENEAGQYPSPEEAVGWMAGSVREYEATYRFYVLKRVESRTNEYA